MIYGSAKHSILKQLAPIQNSAIRIGTGALEKVRQTIYIVSLHDCPWNIEETSSAQPT